MLNAERRRDMRDGIGAIGESTARVWILDLLDHADELGAENAETREVADAFMAGDLNSSFVARAENERLKTENAKLRDTEQQAIKYAARLEEQKERIDAENAALREALTALETLLRDPYLVRRLQAVDHGIGTETDYGQVVIQARAAIARADVKPVTHPRDTDAKGCFCCCNPYAEPNAERAPECPIHGSRADALTGEKS